MQRSSKEIPEGSPEEARTFINYRVSLRTLRRLKALKNKMGFRTYESVIVHIANVVEREGLIPPASYNQVFVQAKNKPVIISGESGSGKTTTVKRLIETYLSQPDEFLGTEVKPRGAFILDVHNEYEELGFRKIDLGKFFSLDWAEGGQKVRFVPNSNVQISQAEAATIFSHLNFIKNGGSLKTWIIVVEEGHRFSADSNLRALLIEARKFVRKLLIVTTDWRVYSDIGQVFKPATWEPAPPPPQRALV